MNSAGTAGLQEDDSKMSYPDVQSPPSGDQTGVGKQCVLNAHGHLGMSQKQIQFPSHFTNCLTFFNYHNHGLPIRELCAGLKHTMMPKLTYKMSPHVT